MHNYTEKQDIIQNLDGFRREKMFRTMYETFRNFEF